MAILVTFISKIIVRKSRCPELIYLAIVNINCIICSQYLTFIRIS